MKNYITLDQATKQGFILEGYTLTRLNEDLKKLDKFKPFCELVPMVYISNYDNKIHFEHITVFLQYKGTLLRPSCKYNEKSFIFFLAESLHVRDFETELTQPNKIGTPTEKKLNEWLTYLLEVEAQKIALDSQRNDKVSQFLDKVNNCGLKVSHQSQNGKRGYIETENFDFFFQVHDNGYIEQKITLRCSQNIDNFLKIAKNDNN